MKRMRGAIFLSALLAATIPAWGATLPSACGSDNVMFKVKARKNQPAPAAPAEGKAQVVFIEMVEGLRATARIGMDGAWVGADKGASYFALDVTPGMHHLCANWQSSFNSLDRQVQLFALNAEPGKVYYFHIKAISTKYFQDFTLAPLNEDEALYLIRTSALSTATVLK